MDTYCVYFSDATESVIVGYFGSPQPLENFPYQATLDEDDPRMQVYLHPELQPAAILKAKQDQKDELLAAASLSMAPILVSLQLGNATDPETATAKAWQTYYRDLLLVDITVETPDWPTPPAE
jgi:Caudovirales tail fibre assembly protein, lambda gpK